MEDNKQVHELKQQLSDIQFIVEGLENYEPYNRMVESFELLAKRADDSWVYIDSGDTNKLSDLRACKLASIHIVNYIDDLKNQMKDINGQIEALENPDKVQTGYYDNE